MKWQIWFLRPYRHVYNYCTSVHQTGTKGSATKWVLSINIKLNTKTWFLSIGKNIALFWNIKPLKITSFFIFAAIIYRIFPEFSETCRNNFLEFLLFVNKKKNTWQKLIVVSWPNSVFGITRWDRRRSHCTGNKAAFQNNGTQQNNRIRSTVTDSEYGLTKD